MREWRMMWAGSWRFAMGLPTVFLALTTTPVDAGAQRTPSPKDPIEIAQAVGRATMSDEVTPKEVRKRALDAAFSDAIGQALGSQVSSVVEFAQEERAGAVKERFSRIIRELSAGTVTRHIVIDESWEGGAPGAPGATYQVKIRAWVRPDAAQAPAAFALNLSLNASRFQDRGTPERSDELILTVHSAADAHLTVFLVTDDSVEVLFPNLYVPDLQVERDRSVEIPSAKLREQLGLRLRTTLPPGVSQRSERLTVVATTARIPFPGVAKRPGADAARVPTIRDTFDALAKWLVGIPASGRSIADVTYEIVRAPADDRSPRVQ